jgi:outer membrane usher protein
MALITKAYAASDEEALTQNLDKISAKNQKQFISFTSTSLFGGQNKDINLDLFRTANYIGKGNYIADVSVNDRSLGELKLVFKHLDASQNAVLCIDPILLAKFDLQEDYVKQLQQKDCLIIKEVASDAYYDFDISTQKLAISIPQKFVKERPQGYIDPARFDKGVNSGFLGYNANFNHSETSDDQYLSLTGGLNIDGWYFRHAGNFQSNSYSSLDNYRSYQSVLNRDVLPIHSRVSIGQFNTSALQQESLPIVGVQLASDLNMLPWSMRYYSPVIENVAYTNALVRIFQNGQKIYERTVPSGPFKITDLTSTSSGNLTLEITENGGEKKTFIIPMQNSLNLLKPEQYDFSLAIGNYKTIDKITKNTILQGSYNYGLNNYLTLLGGVSLTENHQSMLLGTGLNTAIGGFNLIGSTSKSSIAANDYQGQRASLDYIYNWNDYNFNVSLGSTLQSRNYLTLSNALALLNYDDLIIDEQKSLRLTADLKNQFNINFNKSFSNQRLGSFSFGFLTNQYWTDKPNQYQFNLNYGNAWKLLNYSIGASQTNYVDNSTQSDRSIYLSLSLPLDYKKSNIFVNSNYQHNTLQDKTSDSFGANLSGTTGEHNNLNFGVGVSQYKYNDFDSTTYNANINYLLPQTNLAATVYSNGNDTQYSLAAQGAIVAHHYGITATNSLADTYTIVHVDQGAGATVENAWGVKLDRWGNAIYPNVSAYNRNSIAINPDQLPPEITLDSNQTQVIPRLYSSTLATFKANVQSNILLRIHNAIDDTQFPMGSRIETQSGRLIGIMGQSNQSLLSSDIRHLNEPLKIIWGNQVKQSCMIPTQDFSQISTNKMTQLNIVNVECH